MRKILGLIFCILIFSACEDESDKGCAFRILVDIKKASSDISSFLEKIEIVPLETNDSSLLKGYSKMIYDVDKEMYAIMDNRHFVLLFDADGNFISSSEKQNGPGPEQYQIIVDMKFNVFNEGIELFSPYGTIYTYDLSFNFKEKKELEDKSLVFSHFMPYDNQQFLLAPSVQFNNTLCWADYQNGHLLNTEKYSGTLSTLSMNREVFYRSADDYYFIPSGVDYMIYRLDMDAKMIVPYMKLDFGDEEIDEDDLPGTSKMQYVDSEDKGRNSYAKMWKRISYLQNSSYIIPIIKLFSDHYVYVYCLKNNKRSTYLYNRNEDTSCYISDTHSLELPFCFAIGDNVLFAIVEAYEIEKYMNKDYMSEETLERIRKIKEEDNPIILKYYLK